MAHRCIKPQCPTDCSECSHALPEEDEAAMLVCEAIDEIESQRQAIDTIQRELCGDTWMGEPMVPNAQGNGLASTGPTKD